VGLHSSSSYFNFQSCLRETNGFCRTEQANNVSEASEEEIAQPKALSNPTGGRKPAKLAMQKKAIAAEAAAHNDAAQAALPERRIGPIRESRITDRPAKVGEKDSSLKIKIELDLEVEVEIYARIKGDVTIGLM
jgi:hypothetical protein